MKKYLIGADIGGTNTRVSIASKEKIIIKVVQKTKLEGDEHTVPNQVISLIDIACQRAKVQKEEMLALGTGTAGPFKKRDGLLYTVAPNICGALAKEREVIPNDWKEIPLQKDLNKHYGNLRFDNDCVAAVNAERIFGAGQHKDNFVYATISTGIGGGIVQDGKIMRGKNANAGHLGHIYIAEDGPQCGCGNYGDFEALCSGTAIARDYGSKTSEKAFIAYRNKEDKAIKIIQRVARNIGRGLASVNAILDTELFIIGGGMFMNNKDILLPLIKKEFYRSFPALSEEVEIIPSPLEDYLGDIGAFSLVIPKDWIEYWRKIKPWTIAPKPIKLD
ncbi:MAG: ROK family protein [Patescibacteria group bacterium]|nr:ROK family protein [Patescibacteria group bacterium]